MIRIILISLILITNAFCQEKDFNEQEFFKKIKESYYTLNGTGAKNFTSLITNSGMESFAEEQWNNKEIFPFQLIWFAPGKLYLSQQGVPTIKEGKFKEYQDIINGLKGQLKGVFIDLQRFYISGLYGNINDDYLIKHNDQIIEISFEAGDQDNRTQFNYTFGLNGLCLKIETLNPDTSTRVVTYPKFKTVKTKWLCSGWVVQNIKNDEIKSGFEVQLKNSLVNNIWVPYEILIIVQKTEEMGNTYTDIIKIKNYLFNQAVELLNNSKTTN
jgi:hypothetical protein